MPTQILWKPWDRPGLEHVALSATAGGEALADGVIIGFGDGGAAFRARYTVQCDAAWRTRAVRVDLLDATGRRIELHGDGAGRWADEAGAALPALDGCHDVDISATPFTNTLPIRRLAPLGAAAEIEVVYIALPGLVVSRARQRYTRLGPALFRFEALDTGFAADLPIDADGLVEDYPGLFRRVAG